MLLEQTKRVLENLTGFGRPDWLALRSLMKQRKPVAFRFANRMLCPAATKRSRSRESAYRDSEGQTSARRSPYGKDGPLVALWEDLKRSGSKAVQLQSSSAALRLAL